MGVTVPQPLPADSKAALDELKDENVQLRDDNDKLVEYLEKLEAKLNSGANTPAAAEPSGVPYMPALSLMGNDSSSKACLGWLRCWTVWLETHKWHRLAGQEPPPRLWKQTVSAAVASWLCTSSCMGSCMCKRHPSASFGSMSLPRVHILRSRRGLQLAWQTTWQAVPQTLQPEPRAGRRASRDKGGRFSAWYLHRPSTRQRNVSWHRLKHGASRQHEWKL